MPRCNPCPRWRCPTPNQLARAREHRMPPLPAQSWPRDPAWHDSLQQIIAAISEVAPEPAQKDLARLAGFDAERVEALAERVLHTELYGEDAALLPYVAAALQVLWTAGAARLGASDIAALDVPGVCPCCGFLPVASVVRAAAKSATCAIFIAPCATPNGIWCASNAAVATPPKASVIAIWKARTQDGWRRARRNLRVLQKLPQDRLFGKRRG